MAQVMRLDDELAEERSRLFREYLDQPQYEPEIARLLQVNERRLVVNIDHIRQWNREYASGLMTSPHEYIPSFDKAFKDLMLARAPERHLEDVHFHVGLRGSFGINHVNPRTLRANHLGKLICLEGIVTRCSLVRPKMLRSIHYSESDQIFWRKDYKDSTMIGHHMNTDTSFPTKDKDEKPLIFESGLSDYMKYQSISIQEMPERAPAGQLPRSLEIVVSDDLVDKAKPGDRIQLIGIYQSMGNRNNSASSATFRTVIIANNILIYGSKSGISTNAIASSSPITENDIRNITKVSKKRNVFDLLANSLAPSIWGHDHIKKAILLMMLSGMEKNLENGTHIRGDINIMLVGDPSTAKSQMLRFVLNIAPLAIATTGRGSSGVGLTAAVTTDKETSERRLEAGAMVLADRGIVCIDEFDKMSDVDRVAIHEVMEQQTVTIAKAGIHTSLNARCSVLAAANPHYGQYDPYMTPAKNINLPDSLLSRFDLLFVVTDDVDEARDRSISEHVLRMHRYAQPGVEEGTPVQETYSLNLDVDQDDDDTEETPVYQKFNRLLHAGVVQASRRSRRVKEEVLSLPFMKKYIQYAKSRIKPVLTKEATDVIIEEYATLRNKDDSNDAMKTAPITARTLETLIRISTAHAKARLSNRVEEQDAIAAAELLTYAMFKEVLERPKHKRRKGRQGATSSADSDSSEDDDDDDDEQVAVNGTTTAGSRSNGRARRSPELSSQTSLGQMQDLMETDDSQTTRGSQATAGANSGDRVAGFRSRLFALVNDGAFGDTSTAKFDDVLMEINRHVETSDLYTVEEAREILSVMESENKLMVAGDEIVLI